MKEETDSWEQGRTRRVESLDLLLSSAEELRDRTANRLEHQSVSILERSTFLAGLRARRILQAVRALVPMEIDDVIGNLSRSLVETAIDLDYMHVTSTLVRNKKVRILPPETKADLFATQIVIVEKELAQNLRPEHFEWWKQAVAMRQQCGLNPRSAVWHGRNVTGDDGIFEELTAAATAAGDTERTARLDSLLWTYRMTSFFEHNSPNMNFYIESRPEGGFSIMETATSDEVVAMAVLCGADICWTWGTVLNVPEEDRFSKLMPIIRLLRGEVQGGAGLDS